MRGVDGIIYINLDHRTDRREEIEGEFNRLGIPLEIVHRLSGVFDRLNGTKGCLLSHIKALEFAEKKGWEKTLILEDDAQFIENLQSIESALKAFDEEVGSEWDVFLLGGTYLKKEETPNQALYLIRRALSSHAYLIHRPYIGKLKSCFHIAYEMIKDHLLTGQSLHYSLDQVWGVLQNNDRWYAFEEPFAVQRWSSSDIDIVAEPLNRFLRVVYIDTGNEDKLFHEFNRLRLDLGRVYRVESHLEAIEKAMELGRRNTLIVEDTATFPENIEEFDQKITLFFRWIAKNWNLLLLDEEDGEHIEAKHPMFREVKKIYRPKAYAVRNGFYPYLYHHFSKSEKLDALDLSIHKGVYSLPK